MFMIEKEFVRLAQLGDFLSDSMAFEYQRASSIRRKMLGRETYLIVGNRIIAIGDC